MIKNYLLLLAIAVTGSGVAQSPISLSNSNMPGNGDTLRYTNVQIASVSNYTQTGVNFNWDFSNAVSTTEGLRTYKNALQTPYAFYFLGLNEYGEKVADTLVGGTGTVSITRYYNFYKKATSPNAFIADGVGLTISNVPVASYYSDKDELYNFPMTYPKYDSTTFKFTTPSTTLIPVIYSKSGYRVTRVDGWGTVTTPFGNGSCLRIVTTQYSKDTTTITLPAIPPLPQLPPFKIGVQNNQRSYQWFTTGSKIPFFEVTGNLINNGFTVTQVRYRGYNTKPVVTSLFNTSNDISAMELYPNPVKEHLWLATNGRSCEIEILDITGKLIRKAEHSQLDNLLSVDVSDLVTGLYVLKATQDQKDTYLKFIKD